MVVVRGKADGRGHAQVKECGADTNTVAESGMTAVVWAAMRGHTATAVTLVSAVRLGPERAAGGESAAVGMVMMHARTSMMTRGSMCVCTHMCGSGGYWWESRRQHRVVKHDLM